VISGIDYLNQLQWPAMMVTIVSVWLIASQSKSKREVGFWLCLLSNVLWVAWGWNAKTYSIVAMQFALAILNFRGVYKNEPRSGMPSDSSQQTLPD
jgi:hypothetical protein